MKSDATEFFVFQPGSGFRISTSSDCSSKENSSCPFNPYVPSNDFYSILKRFLLTVSSSPRLSSKVEFGPSDSPCISSVTPNVELEWNNFYSPEEKMRESAYSQLSSFCFDPQQPATEPPSCVSGRQNSFFTGPTETPKEKLDFSELLEGKEFEKVYEKAFYFHKIKCSLTGLEKTIGALARSLYEEEKAKRGSNPSISSAFVLQPLCKSFQERSQLERQRIASLAAPVKLDQVVPREMQEFLPLSSMDRIEDPSEDVASNSTKYNDSSSLSSGAISSKYASSSEIPSLANFLRNQVLNPLKEQKQFLRRELQDIEKTKSILNEKLSTLNAREKKRISKQEKFFRSALLSDLKLERQIEVEKLKAKRHKLEYALADMAKKNFESNDRGAGAEEQGNAATTESGTNIQGETEKDSFRLKSVENDTDEDLQEILHAQLRNFLSSVVLPQLEKLWLECIQCPPTSPSMPAEQENLQQICAVDDDEEKADENSFSSLLACGGASYTSRRKQSHRLFPSRCCRRTVGGGISGVLEQEGWHTVYRSTLLECWGQYPFYQLYGGATEDHLKSKPLHTFFKSLRYIQRAAYIQEKMFRFQVSSPPLTSLSDVEEHVLKPSRHGKARKNGGQKLSSSFSTSSTITTVTTAVSPRSSQGAASEREGSRLSYAETLLNCDFSIALDILEQPIWITRIYQPWKREAESLFAAQCCILDYIFFSGFPLQYQPPFPLDEEKRNGQDTEKGEHLSVKCDMGGHQSDTKGIITEEGDGEAKTQRNVQICLPTVRKGLKKVQLEWYVPEKGNSSEEKQMKIEREASTGLDISSDANATRTTSKVIIPSANGRILPQQRESGRVTRYLLRCFLEHHEENRDEEKAVGTEKTMSTKKLSSSASHASRLSESPGKSPPASLRKMVSFCSSVAAEKPDSVPPSCLCASSDPLILSSGAQEKGSGQKNEKKSEVGVLASFLFPSVNICLSKAPVLPTTKILMTNSQLRKQYTKWKRFSTNCLTPRRAGTDQWLSPRCQKKMSFDNGSIPLGKSQKVGSPTCPHSELVTVQDCVDSGLVQCALVFTAEGFQHREMKRAYVQKVQKEIESLREELAVILEKKIVLEHKICQEEGREPPRWSERLSSAL